ncbi:CDP-diacylglycerol-glycerol-3-phosphate 3-phosphatidyltransferase [Artomyces pyxidatus]|uniref:CDP-diacylglycerol-glycerol-3-phosphate 3-phosphatidyltransferase n=1 Tax=Artomyces pyxidatus TaxID=48021 RepID=A0ACB8T0S4_9AGAM|nr:CDP-diacylglycerol-glycerol-3-phosphate 3-phosphatidyltransferase [Artomyces pyxidatus]
MLALATAARRRCLQFTTSRTGLSETLAFPRNFWSSTLPPSIHDFTLALAQTQPCFSVSPSRVRVLFKPSEFYSTLLNMIRRARKRVFISSLYIGSGETELVHTLHDALRRHPSLHVYLQLDLNRSTRPGESSTAILISPLVHDFPERVHVSLFRSPKLKGLLAKLIPPRFNEGWGTWHVKIYGSDDDVMISGANLNKSYFTDRQDRYLQFSAEPEFADYCFAYVQTAASFSYRLLPTSFSDSPSQPSIMWPHSSCHPQHIEQPASQALLSLQQRYLTKNSLRQTSIQGEDGEAFIFPVMQAGQFNIREEERCLHLLFSHLAPATQDTGAHPVLNLTSGYFGLYEPYQKLILQSFVDTRVICASPEANGFYNSRGISGRIPEAYTLLEQRFMKAVHAARREWNDYNSRTASGTKVQLREWRKEGWTYHAKGIWLSPTPESSPILTLFGSTNLNSRSSHLDTELSFTMVTSSPSLREKLEKEVQGLTSYAEPWRGGKRPVRLGTKALVQLVGGML